MKRPSALPSRFASNRQCKTAMLWISQPRFTLFSKSRSEFSEGPMRARRATFFAVILFAAIPGVAAAQSSAQTSTGQLSTVDQVVNRIVAQEKAEMQMLHQYSPLVETYIQLLRPDQTLGTAPAGDKYYLGKANLAKGLDLEPLTSDK